MQYLERVSKSPQAAWYRLLGDHQGGVTRWVVATPETAQICNDPIVSGVRFSNLLRAGMTSAVASAPFLPLLRGVASRRLCIMNFLRGGLNFDLRNVLYDALGSNFHATCFMSSQRYRQDGRWHVKEDMYRKLQIPHGSVLLFGDVVATGVTVDNGVEVIRQHLEQTGTSVRGVVFFTIGCHKLEKALEKHHAQFKQMFPDYEATHVVYFEGKFRLVDQKTRLVIGIPGTDLVKLDALHAPEFEATQYDTITAPLERCVIYDAGSRAFDISEYLRDVIKYWEQVQLLARRGYTLLEALKERWPEREYADHDLFLETKHREWQGVSEDELDAQWARYEVRWTSEFRQWAATADALDCVCEDRRKYIERLLEEAGGNA